MRMDMIRSHEGCVRTSKLTTFAADHHTVTCEHRAAAGVMASFPSARSRRYAPGFDATALALGMTLKLNELERHPKRRLSPSLPALTMLTRQLLCTVGGVQVEVRHADGVIPTLIGRTLTCLSISRQPLVEFVIAQAPTSSSRQLLLPV